MGNLWLILMIIIFLMMVNNNLKWPCNHWIGLWENFNRKPMGFYHQIHRGFRLKFSHHPIL